MMLFRTAGLAIAAPLLLAACSSVDGLFDRPIEPPPAEQADASRPGENPRSLGRIGDYDNRGAAPPVQVAPPPALDLDSDRLTGSVNSVRSTAPSGTFVGKKALQISGDLGTLKRSVQTHDGQFKRLRGTTRTTAEQFHSIVASINAKLQVGTTPGNPILGRQWADAQARLAEISDNVLRMEELRSRVSTDAALGGFLLEQVQAAYSLSGAVDEDHRQLAILEDDVNRTIVFIERLLGRIDADTQRQSAYISRERRNLTTLSLAIKNGEMYGPNLSDGLRDSNAGGRSGAVSSRVKRASVTASSRGHSSRAGRKTSSVQAAAARATAKQVAARQPVVVINFASSNVNYESSLYSAISDAVARNPAASFEVVAVSPGARPGASVTSAKRKADRVVRSLINMGVPQGRLKQSAQTSQGSGDDQVHVFLL